MGKNSIGIVSKADGSARATDWGTPIVLQETSLVKVPLSPDMVQAYKQMGDDLIISLHNGEQIRIEGFFTEFEEDERSELVFEGEDGIAWLASFDPTNSEFVFSEMGAAADAAGAGAATGSISNEAWVAGALGLLALGGIIHNSSSSSSSSGSFVPPKPVEPGDTTAPNAPVVEDVTNNFDEDGNLTDTTIRGEAEAGSTVEVTDPVTGDVVGTGTADEDGKFEVVVEGGLKDGKDYEVTAKDPAGNVSDKETITGDTTAPTGDITAPNAPVVEDVTNNFDEDGNLTDTTIRGEAEAGSTVEVTDPVTGDVVGTGTADEDGKFEVVVEGGLKDGKDYEVTAKDPAGNVSDKETITGDTTAPTGDITAPNAPVVEDVTNNFDEDGNLTDTTIRGEAEAGSTVEVTDPVTGDVVGTGTADEDGKFEVVVEGGLEDGKDYEVTAKDPAGNVSDKETITGDTTAPTGDITAPNAPVVEDVTNNFDEDGNLTDTTIRGEAEAGSTVEVTDPVTGKVVGSGTADGDGKFEVVVEGGLEDAKDYEVTAKDPSGNVSDKETITGDTQAPEAPVVEDVINGFDDNGDITDTTIRGEAEAGSTVEVTDPVTGKVVGSGTADGDGKFEVVVEGGLEDAKDYEVTAKDPAGNVSDKETITGDITAPNAPVVEDVINGFDDNGDITDTTIRGEAEAGSTVEVTDPVTGKVVGSGTADGDGKFEVVVEGGLEDAKDYEVTAKDPSGNVSDKETITGDTQAPEAAVVEDVINGFDDNGDITDTTIRGEAEAGSTVEVTDPETGDIVGSGTADADGKFEVVVEGGLDDAKDYDVIAKDPAGNVSDSTNITGDTTAPEAPTAQLAEDTGLSAEDGITNNGQVDVSGLEPNATWEYSIDGGENWIAGTGDFFTLDEGSYPEGGIQVRQTDAAGNTSVSTQLGEITVDTQPPSIENVKSYNVDTNSPANGEANETVVTFKGEPGATYTVKIGGTTKESIADEEGNHKVTFLPPEAMGAEVIIIGTDIAGNTISATDAVADELRFDDTSAPDESGTGVIVDPITDDNVLNKAESETQVTVSGTVKGEFTAGDTITITVDNNVIGTGDVDADGRFSVTVQGADLVAAEQINVTVEASSAAGVKGEITSEHSYTVDVDAPEVSQVATITLDKSPANGDADITTVSFRGDDAEATYTVVIGDTTVTATGPDADGFYVAEFLPQAADQEVVITATDTAGNSATATDTTPTEVTSGDTEVPQQPEITSVTNSFDEQGDLTGTVIKGKTDGGALVQLYDAQGTLISEVKANINGNFEFAGTVLANGENYTVSAKYELGNSSPAVTVVGDTEAPNVDTVKIVQLDTYDPADGAANQTLLTFNTDEPDATFTFSYVDAQDGLTKEYVGDAQYSAQGNTVSVTFDPPLDTGDKIIITGTDSYGNSGNFTTTEVPFEVTAVGDNTPPELTDVSLDETTDAGDELTSHSFSFTTNDPTATYSVTVNGVKHTDAPVITGETYTYNFTPPLNAGDEVKVEATDPADNTSSASATAEIFLHITGTEQWDTDSPADGKADETIVKFVANNKEPGTFSATDADGKKIDVTVTRLNKAAGEDDAAAPWEYTVTFKPALAEGEKVSIVGNLTGLDEVIREAVAPDSITNFEDGMAPDAPTVDGFTNNKDDNNSTTVTGKAKAGSTVEIIDPDTNTVVGSGTAGNDGKFEIVVENGLANDQKYNVTATDKANNTSEPAIVTGDTIAPEKLADDAIKIGNDGDAFINADEITGGKVKVVIELPEGAADTELTEAGDILVVNGVDYVITAGDVTAGKVEFELDAPKEGKQLTVDALLKDKHNNASKKVDASAKVDTEAPAKPVIDSVTKGEGGEVKGHTEPGATITDTDGNPLKDADDNDIVAGADGNFTIPSDSVPADGIIKAKDDAGNQSEPVNVLKLPGIEQGFDNVASVDEDGNVTAHTNPDDHDKFSNNGFTNDATPYFEIPAGVTGLNETVLIITQNGTSKAVAATKLFERDGKVYLEVAEADKLPDGSYEVQYTTDNTLLAGTEKPTIADNQLSESLTFTVDTQSPAAPSIEEVQNTFDAAGELTGTTISGKVQDKESVVAEAGATVKVKAADGTVVGTGVTDKDGNFIINVTPALADGQDYTVEATDKAGNTSTASGTITGDTTAPAELAKGAIKIGDDDDNAEYINAKEVTEGKFNVTVTLPGADVEAGDILVINGEEIPITEAHLDEKKVEHQLSTDGYAEGETITVDAVIKDAFGNSNAGISAVAILDTQAPEVEFKQINPTEFTLKVSEAGTVVLTDEDGKVLQTIEVTEATAGTNVSVTFDDKFAPNTQIKISATDKAGNVTDTQISVENIRTEASDNTEELVLDIVATQREADTATESIVGEKVTSFGVVSAGLGGVADAGVLDFANNAIELNVAEGTERKLELFADGGGISIGDTYDLIIYKEDAYGNIKFYDVYDSWFTVPFLGMTKNGEITITEPGTYQIMLSAKAGVKVIGGAGLEVTKDTVIDYNDYQGVSGVKKGNVITDLDVSGKDQVDAPDDTRITKITYEDGKGTHEVDVPAVGSTVIPLTYGTLTVSAKGNYTYKLKEGANPQFGDKEEIRYTLTNSNTGDSSSANLTINLVDKPSNLVPDSTVLLDMKPEAIAKDILEKDKLTSKTWADIASVGLGIADIGLIAIENGMDINVGANEVRDVTFYGTGGAPLSLGYSPVDLVIYKKETTANGDFWQLYTIEKDWFGIVGALVGGGASSEDKTFRFDEGEYKAVLIPTTGGVSVIPSVTLRVREDKLYEYKQTNAKVDSNLDLEEGAKVYSVNGDPLGEGDNIIQGQYGTLTIKADGSYSYELYKNVANKDIGAMESFSYSILGADNKLYNSTLNIVINNVQANDDFGDARFGLDNQEAYAGWAVSGTKGGLSNTTYSPELIKVEANQVYDLTLNYSLNPTTSRVDEFVIRLINVATGEVVEVYKPAITGETGELNWSLTEGQYRVEVIIDPRLANTVRYNLNLQGTVTTLDKFQEEQTNTLVEEGNILDNDLYKESSRQADFAHIEVNGKPLDIVVGGKFDNNMQKPLTIEGEHGTLVVQQDGSYTYTAKGDSYGTDVFEYKLTSVAGSSDSAELTFNVGMNATGSEYDDEISSTAGNDTFEGGLGSDTFNFDLLDGDDATGGNGVDTWTDFHFGEVGTDANADANADVLNISALLPEDTEDIDLNGLRDFLKLDFNEEEQSITVSIDRDGEDSRFEFEELLVLTNQNEVKSLDDLFNNAQIIY